MIVEPARHHRRAIVTINYRARLGRGSTFTFTLLLGADDR